MLNEDYKDMLLALSGENVRYLLVGAYALAAHGYPRATMDIDIWVMPSPQNANAIIRALRRFGAPLHNLTKEYLQKDGTIFQIGIAPMQMHPVHKIFGVMMCVSACFHIYFNFKSIRNYLKINRIAISGSVLFIVFILLFFVGILTKGSTCNF